MAPNMVSHWCTMVFDSFKDSVARLDCGQGFCGNGFVVFASGNTCLILTCEHVVHKSKGNAVGSNVSVCFSTGQTFNAQVSYVDKDKDLALLLADNVNVPCTPLRFWEDGDVVTGLDVVLLSFFTMNGIVLVEPGTFPGKIVSEPVVSRTTNTLEIRSDYTSMHGTSGSPVILQRVNKVIGVNNGAFAGIKTATPVPTIKAALREWLQSGDVNMSTDHMLQMIAGQ